MRQNDLYGDKQDCCGCAACFNICPKNAISMKLDDEEFLYPSMDSSLCIDCKQCLSICPLKNERQAATGIQEFAIARSKNMSLVYKASSGGVISEVAQYIIKKGGVVCAANLDRNFDIVHQTFFSMEEMQNISGSKYVQSDKGNIYQRCKEQLTKGKTVLFIGTPCEVGALYSFLGRGYENLLTIDFVYHGVPSKKYWSDYKKSLTNKYESEIETLLFRDKSLGYRSTGMKVTFKNKNTYFASPRTDYMLKAFYSNIINRPSCSKCAFKVKHHISDLTCYDCWNAENVCEECKDDNLGYTNVLINSQKGKKLCEEVNEKLEWHPVQEDDIMPKGGGMLLKSAKKNPLHDEFWKAYEDAGFEAASKNYLNISPKDYWLEGIKLRLHGLGLLQYISKIHIYLKRRKKT